MIPAPGNTNGSKSTTQERKPVPARKRPGASKPGNPTSEPLRDAAERAWAASDRAAARREKRGKTKARAKRKRQEQDEQIASLKGKLKSARAALSQTRRRARSD